MDKLFRIAFQILIFLITLHLNAQNTLVDSLLKVSKVQSGLKLTQTYGELSWEYKNIDLDSCLFFARSCLYEANKTKAEDAKALAYNVLANAFEAIAENDSAFYYHRLSLKIKENLGDSLGMANSYNNFGILYDLTNNYKLSLENYFKALAIYEKADTVPNKLAMVFGNIGIVYKKTKEYDLVLEYYAKALEIYKALKSDFGIAVTNGNMASVFLLKGNFQDCIIYSQQAMDGYKRLGYLRYIPYAESNIAIAYDSLKEYKTAEKIHFSSIKDHLKYRNEYELGNSYASLANNQYAQGYFENAVIYSDSAMYYAQDVESKEFMIKSMRLKANALTKMGRHAEAVNLLENYIVIKDTLLEQNKTKAILELETQYDTEKKQQQIKLQQAEIAKKDLTIKYDRLILAALGILLILITVIALLVVNKQKWKQAKLLEEANAANQRAQMEILINSQEKERKRFAEDIHDGFGQLISVLKLNVNSLSKISTDKSTLDQRNSVYESSLSLINDMYAELRNICFNLMPQTLVKSGLEAALKEFADRINLSGNMNTNVLIYDMDARLSEIQEISIYRIVQEVTNNILKYSNAQEITIQIVKDVNELTLTIEDDGDGFDTKILEQGKGNGLKNINARTNLIKGEFHFESEVGRKGSTFILNIPITKEEKLHAALI